jgi:hypothetical protein
MTHHNEGHGQLIHWNKQQMQWKKGNYFENINKHWHIYLTSFSYHLDGKAISRKKGPQGIFTHEKDATMVAWMLGVQECELSIVSYYSSSK